MNYLLDTHVISQPPKLRPDAAVMRWLSATPTAEMCLSAITIQEVRFGAESMDAGRKRSEIQRWLDQDLLIGFAGRILPVDAEVADECGRMIASARKKKHNPSLDDALIAATARVHGLRIATLDRKHFERLGAELVAF